MVKAREEDGLDCTSRHGAQEILVYVTLRFSATKLHCGCRAGAAGMLPKLHPSASLIRADQRVRARPAPGQTRLDIGAHG